MRSLLASLLLVSVTSTSFAQDPAKGDLAKVQGKWTAKVGQDKDIPVTLEIKDKKVEVVITLEGKERTLRGEFKLDDTKSPREWDWTKFKTFDGDDAPDNLAIYKLDGDSLTVCSGGPGRPRPTAFEAGEGGPPTLIVFTRVKEDAK